jgi:hypothetical protein
LAEQGVVTAEGVRDAAVLALVIVLGEGIRNLAFCGAFEARPRGFEPLTFGSVGLPSEAKSV